MDRERFALERSLYLETERVILRRAGFLQLPPKYFESLNNQDVMQRTESRFAKWGRISASCYVHQANNGKSSVMYSVWHRADKVWIGNVRLFNWSKHHRSAELSFLFFDPEYWGRGLAFEAISEILRFSSQRLTVRRFYADFYASNLASAALFEKLGFKVEGVSVGHFLVGGSPVDSVRVGYLSDG